MDRLNPVEELICRTRDASEETRKLYRKKTESVINCGLLRVSTC